MVLLIAFILAIAFNIGRGVESIKTSSEISEFEDIWNNRYLNIDKRISSLEDVPNGIDTIKTDIYNIKNDIQDLKNNSAAVESTTDETATSETTTTTSYTTTINQEFKDQLKAYIESLRGILTKLTSSDDNKTLLVAYNSIWATEDTMKKEIFDITTKLAENNSNLNTDIKATNDFGTTYHAYTSIENMIKIKNLEMSYDDWLKVAIK